MSRTSIAMIPLEELNVLLLIFENCAPDTLIPMLDAVIEMNVLLLMTVELLDKIWTAAWTLPVTLFRVAVVNDDCATVIPT